MQEPQRGPEEGWDGLDASLASHSTREGTDSDELGGELEPGWRAIRALMQLHSDELLAVMLRPSFRPVHDLELVAVEPCFYCLDGGLRTAGTVRLRRGRATVRACDTCGRVDLGGESATKEREA